VRGVERGEEARREFRRLLVEVGRVEEEAVVANGEAGALLADAALAHHRDDLAAGHRVHEHRPLLQRRAFGVVSHAGRLRAARRGV
jgi:hypothetical protein